MLYHFDVMGVKLPRDNNGDFDPMRFNLVEFKKVFTNWDSTFAQKGWGPFTLAIM